jgi:hypothetical protein
MTEAATFPHPAIGDASDARPEELGCFVICDLDL